MDPIALPPRCHCGAELVLASEDSASAGGVGLARFVHPPFRGGRICHRAMVLVPVSAGAARSFGPAALPLKQGA